MTVVYVLGTGSRWKNYELLYSLRSIEKNLKGFTDVVIVGELPTWIQNVIHIPAKDIPFKKEFSIFSKIVAACNDERVSENFLFINDDHFLIKEIEVKNVNYYYQFTLLEKWAKAHGHYKQSILNVIEALNEVGGNDKYFDIHTPIIYNKKKFLELENFDWKKEYVIKSLYTNLQKFITLEEMTDCKINRNMTYDEIKA